jgi:hypothetical protein
LKAPSQDKARMVGEARRSRPASTENPEFEREETQRIAADNDINLEDDLDARIQAELNQVVSGTTKDEKPTQGRPRPSMTFDQLEEMMPWELYPPPPSPVVHALPGVLATVGGASESGVAAGKRRVSFIIFVFLVHGAFPLEAVLVSQTGHILIADGYCNAFPNAVRCATLGAGSEGSSISVVLDPHGSRV